MDRCVPPSRNERFLTSSQMISLHDGFQRQDLWFDFLEGSDRVALDTHSYLCFTEPNDDPLSLQALKVRWQSCAFRRGCSRLWIAALPKVGDQA